MALSAATSRVPATSRPAQGHNHQPGAAPAQQPSLRCAAARCQSASDRGSQAATAAGTPSRGGRTAALLLLALLGLAALLLSPQGRRAILGAGLSAGLANALVRVPPSEAANPVSIMKRQGEVKHTEEEWQKILSTQQYRVLRNEATELPYSSPLNNEKREGTFTCAGCGSPLFPSSTKFNSGTGWPSFFAALPGAVDQFADLSIPFLPRTEVRCHKCQGHLGHVFDDGPKPTGLRFCMNGAAMNFTPVEAA